jgi:predicted phosphodiesterase
MADSKLVKDIVKEIERIAGKLGIEPYQLSKAKFMELSKISSWDLTKVGGYATLISTYFPFPDKSLKDIQLLKARKSYINKLEKQYGSWEVFAEQLTESLCKRLETMHVEPNILNEKATKEYIKSVKKNELHDSTPRSICVALTDVHFGTHIDKEELGGKNEFNWDIAARRYGFIIEQLETYKMELRHLHEEVVFLLGGDLIGGVIHNQEGSDYDLITYQVAGALSYFIQGFEHVKAFYPKIRIVCQPGNHGRMMHKEDKGRALSQKYDSFENIIFNALSWYFKNDPKVEIIVPKSPYAEVTVQGHRIYMTHGDGVFITGNPGKSINTERIEQQVHRINEEERLKNRKPFELFVFGHVHQAAHFQTNSGTQILINGSMIGTDSYAQGVGIMSNNPVQVMWEMNSKFAVGDSRWLFVAAADKEQRLEQIIKPYNYELTA